MIKITYLVIFIFVIIALFYLCKIPTTHNNNSNEAFLILTEDQILGDNNVLIKSMDDVKFGSDISTASSLLTTITNLQNSVSTLQTSLATLQASVTPLQTSVSTLTANQLSNTNNYVPSLTIMSYTGTNVPIGWQLCDGATLKFSNSQTIVTTSYANTTNFTQLNVSGINYLTPDLRGRFVLGTGSGTGLTDRTIKSTGGSQDATLLAHSHTATVNDPGHSHDFQGTVTSASGTPNSWSDLGGWHYGTLMWQKYTASATTGISVTNSSSGSTGIDLNMPPFYVLTYIIKQPNA